jgi:hypothetical protein
MHLYLSASGQLEEVAGKLHRQAFQGWRAQLRDGLNLGGGEYYNFERPGAEVLLVCNDEDHAEVFIEERRSFPFYLYARKGGDTALEEIKSSLDAIGVISELHEDT